MIKHVNGETENQAKKAGADVHRSFQDGNSSPEIVVLLPAMPRIVLAVAIWDLIGWS